MNLARISMALLLAATAGCRSAPAHYYSLTPKPPFSSIPLNAPQVNVKVTNLPASADRLQLVVHQGSEISILENHQWIAPLSNEIETALSVELLRRLSDGAGATRGYAVWSVRVNILQLEAYPADRVFIAASWIAKQEEPQSAMGFTCHSEISESIHPGVDAIVDGYRTLILSVADQIAASMRVNTIGTGVQACPPN
jgi:hypothetical protein